MHYKDTRETATGQVLAHVERAKVSLKGVHANHLSTDRVFFNPPIATQIHSRAQSTGRRRIHGSCTSELAKLGDQARTSPCL